MKLYDYQKEGVEFLVRRRYALLADDMGLGKTPQAIVAADEIGAENILVLCPASARINWEREIYKFSSRSLPVTVMLKGSTEPKPGVVITSYDLARDKSVYKKLGKIEWDAVILDESHYLKNKKAKQTKAVYGNRCKGGGLAREKSRIWCLSGTPAPNNPAEMWPMLHRFNIFSGDYWAFVKKYCTGYDNGFGYQITGARNIPELRRVIEPIILRRKKMDVRNDLPSLTYRDIFVEFKSFDEEAWFPELMREGDHARGQVKDQEKAIQGMLTSFREKKLNQDQFIKALEAQSSSMSLMRRWIGLSKVKGAAELIKDHLEGGMEKCVVFAHHRNVIMMLQHYLKDYKPVLLYGGTPAEKRQKNIDKFMNEKVYKNTGHTKNRVFIGQITAAGTAINLTAAHDVFFVECSWVPGENVQASMRVHRDPQRKPVVVRFLALENSIDEHIMKVYRRKANTLSKIFD
jgi:SWI/SNF-related matrix-associated actin-dependent regulator 1 of chromatin subfamily A